MFTLADALRAGAERLAVINPAIRGDFSGNKGDSGAKMALLAATSAQFSQGFQGSLRVGDEGCATHMLQTLQTHAKAPRVVTIAGRHNTYQAKRFTGDDINQVATVIVQAANPMRDSFVGRQQLVEWYMKIGVKMTPQNLWAVLNTGRMDQLWEGEQSEALLIRRENEILSDPESTEIPIVSPFDDHAMHLGRDGHGHVAANPDTRKDPRIAARLLAHQQQHIDALRNLDPGLLMALGQKPMPPKPPPGMPPGTPTVQPNAGPPGPPKPPGPPSPPERPTGPGGVMLPQAPVNPATGQRPDIAPPTAAPPGP